MKVTERIYNLAKEEHPALFAKYSIAKEKAENERTKLDWAAYNAFIYILEMLQKYNKDLTTESIKDT